MPPSGIDARSKVRILIVDGHPITRLGLLHLMQTAPELEVVGQAADAESALAMVALVQPHVVTVGCLDGTDDACGLTAKLRAAYPDLGIVILTSSDGDDLLFRALETGASAFVGKSADVTEILAAVRHAGASARSFTASGLAAAMARRRATPVGPQLSPRERDVLALLSAGHSIPSVGKHLYISISTAKTYVARLYDKLGASNRAQAVAAAARLGLIDDVPAMPVWSVREPATV